MSQDADYEGLIKLCVSNRLCPVERYWDAGDATASMFTNLGTERATHVLISLRKKLWVNRCESKAASIQDTAESIRNIVREIVAEREAGEMSVDNDMLAEAALAVKMNHAYVVSYQHQNKGPGLTPVSERMSDDQILEVATILTHHEKSKANEVHIAFDFTSLAGAQSETRKVSWASVGLDVFKVARVIYVTASRSRNSDWSWIELNCAQLYGSAIALDPELEVPREIGSKIEFETAEIVLAQVLIANFSSEATTTMRELDLRDLEQWALSRLDTTRPTPNGTIPMLNAIAPEGSIRDEEETWISLIANGMKGLLDNYRDLSLEDRMNWEYHLNHRRWRDSSVGEEMQEYARCVDDALWGPGSSRSEKRFDFVFYNDATPGSECYVIITNELSHDDMHGLSKDVFNKLMSAILRSFG